MTGRIALIALVAAIAATLFAGCGKRGEPYRPSEVPSQSANGSSGTGG